MKANKNVSDVHEMNHMNCGNENTRSCERNQEDQSSFDFISAAVNMNPLIYITKRNILIYLTNFYGSPRYHKLSGRKICLPDHSGRHFTTLLSEQGIFSSKHKRSLQS